MVEYHGSDAVTPRYGKTDATLRDMTNFLNTGVAPPRSIDLVHLASSLLGLAEIGLYRGRRYFEIGSEPQRQLIQKPA